MTVTWWLIESQHFPLNKWIPIGNATHRKRSHIIAKMNDNINLESAIVGSMNALNYLTTVLARKVEFVGVITDTANRFNIN